MSESNGQAHRPGPPPGPRRRRTTVRSGKLKISIPNGRWCIACRSDTGMLFPCLPICFCSTSHHSSAARRCWHHVRNRHGRQHEEEGLSGRKHEDSAGLRSMCMRHRGGWIPFTGYSSHRSDRASSSLRPPAPQGLHADRRRLRCGDAVGGIRRNRARGRDRARGIGRRGPDPGRRADHGQPSRARPGRARSGPGYRDQSGGRQLRSARTAPDCVRGHGTPAQPGAFPQCLGAGQYRGGGADHLLRRARSASSAQAWRVSPAV